MATRKGKTAKPTATIILISIGGILILLNGILAIFGLPLGFTFIDGHMMIQTLYGISVYHGIIETLTGIILVVAATKMNTSGRDTMQNWSIVALAFSVISLIGGGGFLAGFVLAFIGSIFGIASGYLTAGKPVYYVRQKEGSERATPTTDKASGKILATMKGEEKKLYELTEGAGGAIFQADLVEKSGFSKVKVSRILDKLEGRGLIERKRRGMTNMVVINMKNSQ